MPAAEQLEAAALALRGRPIAIGPEPSRIRISVGEWAGDFLAQCLSKADNHLPDGFAVELVTSDQTVSLTHREADLAVRHGRPETGNLYVSRVGTIACAAYQSPGLPTGAAEWITLSRTFARGVSSVASADASTPEP